ncbi:hypothetical protein RHMOL_Rhmol05G0209400 [Rhododendron molle]|uniref:Uncharacterized protein n=1 Tax=Rhododendron molle TaxID=49168 RepID=A0ACC0NR90_RHOML|nr:hypothetical protein RHMOL_Rhmol05G0209400 [Rhododendron molle]
MKTVACLVLCLWLAALTNLCFADDEQLSDLSADSAWFDSQSNHEPSAAPSNHEEPSAAPSLDEEQQAKHKPHKAPAPTPTSPEAPTPKGPSSPGHKHKHKHHKHRKTPAPTPSPAVTPPQHP